MVFDKKRIKLIILYLVSLTIFAILISKINFHDLLQVLQKTNLILLLVSIVLFFLNLIIRTEQLRAILKYFGLVMPLSEMVFLELGSFPSRILFPIKSGEIVQALYLKKRGNFPLKKGISSLIMRLIFNFLTLFFYVLIGTIFLKISFIKVGIWMLIVLLIILLIFILAFIFRKNYLVRIHKYFKELLNKFKQIQLTKTIFLFIYSLIFFLIILLICFLLFKSLSINVPFNEILFFMPIIFILMQIPITIAGFGTREALIIYFFSSHASIESLLSVGLLISLVMYIIPAIFGMFLQKRLFETILNK